MNLVKMPGYNPLYGAPLAYLAGRASGTKTSGGMSYSRTVTKKRKRGMMKRKSFKRRVLDSTPAKHNTFETAINLLQGETYTIMPSRAIVQGTANNQRLGDDVHLEAIKVRGTFISGTPSRGYIYRLIVGYTGEEIATLTTWSAAGLTINEIGLPSTGSNNPTNVIINPKAFTVLYDETYELNSQVTDAKTLHNYDITIKLNKDFPYQSGGSTYGKFKNLACVLLCHSPDAAAASNIGSINTSVDLIFKD